MSIENEKQEAHRRHSSRSIKRKKFDDELVESSLRPHRRSSDSYDDIVLSSNFLSNEDNFNTSNEEDIIRKLTKNTQDYFKKYSSLNGSDHKKNARRHRQAFSVVKDMSRWKPTDDILLIDAVEQIQELSLIHLAVKFSCRFSLEEIQERWYALLYDPVISNLAKQSIKNLPLELVEEFHSRAPFSKEEEDLLSPVLTGFEVSEDIFRELLENNVSVFHSSRTPSTLQKHWLLKKHYHLLDDQDTQTKVQNNHILNFSDAEDLLDDHELSSPKEEVIENEIRLYDRKQKHAIKRLEEEIPRWDILISSVTDMPIQELDQHTVAVLRGRLVRYLMRSRIITIGRNTESNTVDINLALEGPAYKISRQQGTIEMKDNGDFALINKGKRSIFVNGKPILQGNKINLHHECVIEIALLRFVFLINQNLVIGKAKGE